MVVEDKLDSTKKKKRSCAQEKLGPGGWGQAGLHQEEVKEVVQKKDII